MPRVAELRVEEDARAIGAVNTLIRQGDRWRGANTDAEGLCRALREARAPLHGARVLILGAGGAARAATVGCNSRTAGSLA